MKFFNFQFCLSISVPLLAFALSGMGQSIPAAGIHSWASWKPGNVSRVDCPELRGVPLILKWNQLEPSEGDYQFESLVGAPLQVAADDGLYATAMIWVGPACPEWIYGLGVPEVFTDRTVNALGQPISAKPYPYPFSTIYMERFIALIDAFGTYLNNLPEDLQQRIVFVQSAEGSTGDPAPYKGKPLDPQYEITDEEWYLFRKEIWSHYLQSLVDIPLMVNSSSKSPEQSDWVLDNLDILAVKNGMFSHGYHVSGNKERLANFKTLSNRARSLGKPVINRGEMDGELFVMGWSSSNIPRALYWSGIFAMHCELDIWNVPNNALKDEANAPALEFFNKYAGHWNPALAPGAFCALRDGLDASDFERFPAEVFGGAPGQKKVPERYLNIAQAYESRGARMDDVESAMGGGMLNRKRSGPNDVGWAILPSNYERFLYQLNSGTEDVGWWNIDDSIYGRFGRGFDHGNGKDTLYFDVHDKLLPSRSQRVRLSVIYLDTGTGQFELQYDADSDSRKSAFVVTKTNSNKWKTESVVVDDWAFQNKGPNGADLMLLNVDSEDDIFHLVELVKLSQVTIGTVGKGSVSGRADATVYDPVVGPVNEGQRLELTVTPESGWEFVGWSGDLDGTNTRQILFTAEDTRITAHFAYGGTSVASDDFDSNSWTGGTGWSGGWSSSGGITLTSYGGGITILLNSNGQITRDLISALANASLTIDHDIDSLDTGETATAEVFDGSWHVVWVATESDNGGDRGVEPDALVTETIDLAAYGDISKIRFTVNAGGGADRFWIDNITLTGDSEGGTHSLPLFAFDPVEMGPAVEGVPFSGTLAGSVNHANGDPMTFSMGSGPGWLSVAPDGTLSGMPTPTDVGLNHWIVEVTNEYGAPDKANLLLYVEPDGTPALSYADWSSLYRLNQAQEGDDDGDTELNLMEFANGGSPVNPFDRGHRPAFEIKRDGGSTWFEYAYAKRGSCLNYQLEFSSSLAPGSWSGNGYTETGSDPLNGYFNLITNRIDLPADSPVFIRLIVEEY
ncbi:hypothetical protein G0Q06_00960 [Puniceicoccales bacterium CK1056]|uniref:Bacterial repeat domain-containing protein n=1 Tax=Oceanipulchritudo coccoides TaxID=2706888 RepID=A0A6B2LY13_9BACT|nr:hypothetical protein [Oceanipulchritudo coccoides]NDV61012.1 hypothetical protein [Oceanipulchritudo coccoides]